MDKSQDKTVLIATYGSLRLGQYNYTYFKQLFDTEYEYVRTTSIPGFALYSLGAYPAVIPDKEAAPLVVDIFKCSEQVHSYIKHMELGAGYFEEKININGRECIIYVYADDEINVLYKLVESGNWVKYVAPF